MEGALGQDEQLLRTRAPPGIGNGETELLQDLSNALLVGPLHVTQALELCDEYLGLELRGGQRVADAAVRNSESAALAMTGRFDEARRGPSPWREARSMSWACGSGQRRKEQPARPPSRCSPDWAAAERELRRGAAAFVEMGVRAGEWRRRVLPGGVISAGAAGGGGRPRPLTPWSMACIRWSRPSSLVQHAALRGGGAPGPRCRRS